MLIGGRERWASQQDAKENKKDGQKNINPNVEKIENTPVRFNIRKK